MSYYNIAACNDKPVEVTVHGSSPDKGSRFFTFEPGNNPQTWHLLQLSRELVLCGFTQSTRSTRTRECTKNPGPDSAHVCSADWRKVLTARPGGRSSEPAYRRAYSCLFFYYFYSNVALGNIILRYYGGFLVCQLYEHQEDNFFITLNRFQRTSLLYI